MATTFAQARRAVGTRWPDYSVSPDGFDGGASWFVLLLPPTAGGRIAAVSKTTGAIRWINETADEYTEQHPVSAS